MSADHLADELIRILVDLVTDEPELVGELIETNAEPSEYVEAWHLVNNCTATPGVYERLALAIGDSA